MKDICILDNIEIEKATAEFNKLMRNQAKRARRLDLEEDSKINFQSLDKIIIGVLPGDGIGPIIMKEAVRLIRLLLADELGKGTVEIVEIEGLTIENRMSLGESVPSSVMDEIRKCHVILKGPTTTPRGGAMKSANVTLRSELDLFANIRPVLREDMGIDWTFFRENTEGEYVLGSNGVEIEDLIAVDFKVTTKAGIRRIAKAAFDYATDHGKSHVAIVTKANIMKKTDGMFSRICHEVAKKYPNITAEDFYVDIMAANLINPKIRKDFQVFVLPNLYGDILTDEAAQIQGGVGTAGSANIGDRYGVFEAIHGSAPKMVEDGLAEYANPSSIFQAVSMMLAHVGFKKQASIIDEVMGSVHEMINSCGASNRDSIEEPDYEDNSLKDIPIVTGYRDGATCSEFSDWLLDQIIAKIEI